MPRTLDNDIQHLKSIMLDMGGLVEKSLERACSLIIERNPSYINEVAIYEDRINNFEIEIDSKAISLLARNAPVAQDLRRVMAIVKINTDLERMGDQVQNICYNGRDYLARRPVGQVEDLIKLASKTQIILKDSLDAFGNENMALANEILKRDDEIDSLRNAFVIQSKKQIMQQPDSLDAVMDLMMVARALERIGDHSTNIGEETIYVCSGEDVRHRKSL